jgi:IS30 family transposase
MDVATQNRVWELLATTGETPAAIARVIGMDHTTVQGFVRAAGGVRPRPRQRSARHLSLEEREEISRGLAVGVSMREVAVRLGRSCSTVSREVARNGGARRYRATTADRRAWQQGCRPKPAKLATNRPLRRLVEDRLSHNWSPRAIARWLAEEHPGRPELHVSHETIYQSLYVQGRGALRRELHQALRTGRAMRKPRGRTKAKAKSHIPEMVMISERPADVADRAVPGHWEGDLIEGTRARGRSYIGTLVERKTRFVMLLKLENGTADEVLRAMKKKIKTLPRELRRSVTWDQGNEMTRHREFTIATGMQVYFCDPSSPWQRGSNEQTNGLLRQYFPKGTDLSVHSQAHLNWVARELNERPRETLGFRTPLEVYKEVVASTP